MGHGIIVSGLQIIEAGFGVVVIASVAQGGSEPTAAGGGVKGGEGVAAVEKIEDQRKPDDFFGHRNRGARFPIVKLSILPPVGLP